MMKPSPNAAPIMPNALARFLTSVTSVMYACATDRLPPVRPSRMRLKNNTASTAAFEPPNSAAMGSANPSSRKPRTVPAMLTSRIGRRP